MTLENKTVPTVKQIEEVIWDSEAKRVLNEVYDIWDQIQRKETLELKPKIKELELTIHNNIVKHGLGDNKLVVSMVCSIICRRMERDGKDERLRIMVVKTVEREHLLIELSNLRSVPGTDLPEECSIFANEVLSGPITLKGKFPEHFGVRNFQEIAQEFHDGLNRIEKLADEYGIPLPYHSEDLPNDRAPSIRLKAADIPEDEKIRLAQKKSRDQWINSQTSAEDRVKSIIEYNYVSGHFQTEQSNIFTKEALTMLEKPLVDKKWQRDWGEWCDILWNYYELGGTYASSKSTVDSATIDEKTGKPIRRRITKEQIDAKHVSYINEMRYMITHLKPNNKLHGIIAGKDIDKLEFYKDPTTGEKFIRIEKFKLSKPQTDSQYKLIINEMRQLIKDNPGIESLYKRFREKERAYRASRSIELHDVLSEAA